MGCPSKAYLNDGLVFGICTHDPDTGVLTDTDSDPIYRVYEDEVETPVLTGTMSKLDDTNTTGFYSEFISCTQQNRFNASKTYTIYIEAIVAGDTGGMCYAFKVYPSTKFEPLYISTLYNARRLATRGVEASSGGSDTRFQALGVSVFYKVKRRDKR